ncbi:MAG: hypothetical protein LBQ88_01190 [Treponema sp.]|jgi:hypothetical protein|nr:hypothetical protein [Treponema sp.]
MKTLTSIFGILGICFFISIFSCASGPSNDGQPDEEQISTDVSVGAADQKQSPEVEEAPNKQQEVRDKMTQAQERLDWAASVVAKRKFPCPYDEAKNAYREAQRAENQERWDDAAANAGTVIEKVAEIEKLYNEMLAREDKEPAENAEDAIAEAKSRLEWANSINAKSRFPGLYNNAESKYQDALKAQSSKDWRTATDDADNALGALSEIERLNNQALADASKSAPPAASSPASKSPDTNVAGAAQVEAERVRKEQEAAAESERVKSQQTDDAIAKAKERLDWASSIQARTKFPESYTQAENAYNDAVLARNNKNWDGASANAAKVVTAVDEIERLNEIAAAAEADERIKQAEAERVKAQQADDAIAKAKERMDWASSIQAARRFPSDFTQANDAFNSAQRDKNDKNYDSAISNANRALAAVDQIERLNTPAAEAERTGTQPRFTANADQDRARQADEYIARAKERIDWAISIQAGSRYPNNFNRASTAYGDAIRSRNALNWDNAIINAIRAINAIDAIEQLNSQPPAQQGGYAEGSAPEAAAQIPAEQQAAAEKAAAEKAAVDAAAEKAAAEAAVIAAAEKAAAEKAAADKAAAEAAAIAAAERAAEAEAAEAEKAKAAGDAVAKAKERMDWANSIQARTKFPQPYNRANTAYNNAVRANTGKNYDTALTNANQTIAAVAEIEQLNAQAAAAAEKAAAEKAAEAEAAEAEKARIAAQIQAEKEAAAIAAAEKILADAARVKAEQEAAAQAAAERIAREQAAAEAAAQAASERASQEQAAPEAGVRAEQEAQTLVEGATEEGETVPGDLPAAEISAVEPAVSENPDTEAETKAQAASKALADAKERLDLAVKVNGDRIYPDAYTTAENAYSEATDAFAVEDWDKAISAASAVITALNVIEDMSPLPAQYEVRTWVSVRDCFWNISGYPYVYNDPFEWRRLYNANTGKLENRQNPDLIEPGLILDIPSIRGEYREGIWEENKRYPPLPGIGTNR